MRLEGEEDKLAGAVDSHESREALERELAKLEYWATASLLKFKKNKCWILHLRQCNLGCKYRLGNKRLVCSPAERDLGVLVDGKLNITQQNALVTKRPTMSWCGLSTV